MGQAKDAQAGFVISAGSLRLRAEAYRHPP